MIDIQDPAYDTRKMRLQTRRFTYSISVADELASFAKKHEYDERVEFKSAWKVWIEEPEIKLLIENEITRLQKEGRIGNIMDGMYKSVRYYYRKKPITKTNPEPRKIYEGLPRKILQSMDAHILREIEESIDITKISDTGEVISNISPSDSFARYCEEHRESLTEEQDNNKYEERERIARLKKTYNNRYYRIKIGIKNKK